MSQLAFGAPSGLGAGDACGRCFRLSANQDPYSPSFAVSKSIVVKTTDLCPVAGNEQWCGQTTSTPTNSFGQSVQCVIALSPPVTCWRAQRDSVALTCARTPVLPQHSSHRATARSRAHTRKYRAVSGPARTARACGTAHALKAKTLLIGPQLAVVIKVRSSLCLRHEKC
jgi:hypothetical protein